MRFVGRCLQVRHGAVVGRNGLMCRFARGWLSDLKATTYGEVSDRDGRDAGDAICRSVPLGPTWGGGGAQWFDMSLSEGMAVGPEGRDLRGDVGPEGSNAGDAICRSAPLGPTFGLAGRNGLICRFARGWLSDLKATTYGGGGSSPRARNQSRSLPISTHS